MQVPHPIPYQGSKRRLAATILDRYPQLIARHIEPFAGSGAVTLAAAARNLAQHYIIGDSLEPLIALWSRIIDDPVGVSERYAEVWDAQLSEPREHYLRVRDEFNETGDPVLLLYLLTRCVKNAVRFNARGEFNQSADHRRRGMHPNKMRANVVGAARLLAGRSSVVSGDYSEVLKTATDKDLVYMDPPYQGVSGSRDPRYFEQMPIDRLLAELEVLNSRSVPYLLSYDGSCGEKVYGEPLPDALQLTRLNLRVGRSSQATLSGQSAETVESLYVSPALATQLRIKPATVSIRPSDPQLQLSL